MSIIGTHARNGRISQSVRNVRAEQNNTATEELPADTPYLLLWSSGIVAFVLGIVAFFLWGINGASTLFDMMVALCT